MVDSIFVAIKDANQHALLEIVKQIIVALQRNNYEFDSILEALAEYTKGRSDWGEVTKHLELARLATIQASQRLLSK